jgi:hypothetical protein
MHQSLQGATFHLEHIIPSARGGPTTLPNLAWACPTCNLRKSDREVAVDHESGKSVPLYNPREGFWHDHFLWNGYHVVGRTPTGRATLTALDLNHPKRILIRHAEEIFGMFPPESEAS